MTGHAAGGGAFPADVDLLNRRVGDSLRPRMQELGLSLEAVGDVDTLLVRLERELDDHRSYAVGVGLVGAWSRSKH